MKSSPFLDLINEEQIGRMVKAIEEAISLSFAEDFSRVTGAEVRRRFKLCEKIFRELRGDLGWALQRIIDHLPKYLRCELDGVDWKPETRPIWAPKDENKEKADGSKRNAG